MSNKCPFCGESVPSGEEFCPNCGTRLSEKQPESAQEARVYQKPRTIEQLKEFCREKGMPLYTMRFFIGEDYRQPRAFGIFRNENGEFVVYKNKDDGTRAIRYQGPDEAFAVNEIYEKLKSETKLRSRTVTRSGLGARVAPPRRRRASLVMLLIIVTILTMCAMILISFFSMRGGSRRGSFRRGYYEYNDTDYYYYDNDWYSFDPYAGIWLPEQELDPAFAEDPSAYYRSYSYDDSYGTEDFEDSEYYYDSSYDSDSYDDSYDSDYDDYDWDSGSDSWDSWDSSDTDWGSDW